MFQDTRKKDSSTTPKKIFLPFDDDYRSDNMEKLMEEYTTPIKKEKYIRDKELKKLNTTFISNKKVKKLNLKYIMETLKEGENKSTKKFYKAEMERASSSIKYLNKRIEKDLTMPI